MILQSDSWVPIYYGLIVKCALEFLCLKLGPHVVALFKNVVDPLGDGASLEELNHWETL